MPGQLLMNCHEPKLSFSFCSTVLTMCPLFSEVQALAFNSSFVAVLLPRQGETRQPSPFQRRSFPAIQISAYILLMWPQPFCHGTNRNLTLFVLFLEKQIIDNSWKIGRCYRQSHEAIMEHITDKEIQVVRGAGLPIVVNLCRHLSASDQAVWWAGS